MSNPAAPPMNWKRAALAGYALIFSTFGIAGGWASVTKIDRAVVAPATVSVEANRKIVQHLEGGIISEVLVKEGDLVEQEQVLIRLERVQAQANSEMLGTQLATTLAIEARLVAERSGSNAIRWPSELLQSKAGATIARAIEDQTAQFTERRSNLIGQTEILEARIQQLKSEIEGHTIERRATEAQIELVKKELESLRRLSAEDLVPMSRLYAVERERTRLEGAIGRATAEIAKCKGSIGEVTSQIQQVKKKFAEDVAAQLAEVRQKLHDLQEKRVVALDVLSRIEITSPRAGTVQNLKVSVPGQVVRPGEALLEIVPKDEPFVIMAQFSPNDIDGVQAGKEVEVRFPAFPGRTLPVMLGMLESVSQDRLIDEITKQPYFLGIVAVDQVKLPSELRVRLRSGMPAEVIAASGERTVLEYLISPLTNSMRKLFIEQ